MTFIICVYSGTSLPRADNLYRAAKSADTECSKLYSFCHDQLALVVTVVH